MPSATHLGVKADWLRTWRVRVRAANRAPFPRRYPPAAVRSLAGPGNSLLGTQLARWPSSEIQKQQRDHPHDQRSKYGLHQRGAEKLYVLIASGTDSYFNDLGNIAANSSAKTNDAIDGTTTRLPARCLPPTPIASDQGRFCGSLPHLLPWLPKYGDRPRRAQPTTPTPRCAPWQAP